MDAPSDWQISKHQVVERGKYLLESGELSDCKFIVGEDPQQQQIVGHKILLAMASPVFTAMFYGGVAEKNDLIPIPDVQPPTFKSLLKYIYTDKVDLKSFESVCDLLYCAKKYMLQYLVQQCTTYLCSNISSNKVYRTYEFATLLEVPALMDKCMDLICTKTVEVLYEPSWEEIRLDTLLAIFEQNKLDINTEMELFTAAERWAKAECFRKSLNPLDTKCLRSVIKNALSKIRFLTLTPQEFAVGLNNSSLLTEDEAFAIFMNISSSESHIPMLEEFSTNSVKRKIIPKPAPKHCNYCRRDYY